MRFLVVLVLVVLSSFSFGDYPVTAGERVSKHPRALTCSTALSYQARRQSLFSEENTVRLEPFQNESEQNSFLKAIKANPADDMARLAYADWLDEHGDPAHAEYIRLEIRLNKLSHLSADYRSLRNRASELLWANEARWLPRQLAGADEYEWKRGFVSRISLSAGRFLVIGPALLESLPGLETLEIMRRNEIVQSEGWGGRLMNWVFGDLYIRDLTLVLSHPSLARLSRLILRDSASLLAFTEASSEVLRNLKELEILLPSAEDLCHLFYFFETVKLPELETLVIVSRSDSDRDLMSLPFLKLPDSFPGLKHLEVRARGHKGGLTAANLEALGNHPELRLETICIGDILHEDINLSPIASLPGFAHLRRFYLGTNQLLTQEEVMAFLKSPYLKRFTLYDSPLRSVRPKALIER